MRCDPKACLRVLVKKFLYLALATGLTIGAVFVFRTYKEQDNNWQRTTRCVTCTLARPNPAYACEVNVTCPYGIVATDRDVSGDACFKGKARFEVNVQTSELADDQGCFRHDFAEFLVWMLALVYVVVTLGVSVWAVACFCVDFDPAWDVPDFTSICGEPGENKSNHDSDSTEMRRDLVLETPSSCEMGETKSLTRDRV